MAYTFTKYSAGGGASEEEVVQIVKTNFEGGVGYEEITVTEIIPETTIEGRWESNTSLPFVLGESYEVTADGVVYSSTCKSGTFDGMEVLAVGNVAAIGLEDTGEPFVFLTLVAGSMSMGVFLEGDSHTFSIHGKSGTVAKINNKFVDAIGWRGEGLGAEIFNTVENQATGEFAHAEGAGTTAGGFASHTEGKGTIASSSNQHAQGEYNIVDTANKYAHIVGNGTSSARSNAHTIDWEGNAWFAGKVKVGGTGYDDPNAVEIGAGSSGGGGIIDVTALPTENINESAFYRVTRETQIYIPVESKMGYVTLKDWFASMGANMTTVYSVVDTTPTEVPVSSMSEDMSSGTLYIYIANDTGVGYVDMGAGVMPLSAVIDLPDGGWCDDIESMELTLSTFKIYAVKGGAKVYAYCAGEFKEVTNEDRGVDGKVLVAKTFGSVDEALLFVINQAITTPYGLFVGSVQVDYTEGDETLHKTFTSVMLSVNFSIDSGFGTVRLQNPSLEFLFEVVATGSYGGTALTYSYSNMLHNFATATINTVTFGTSVIELHYFI